MRIHKISQSAIDCSSVASALKSVNSSRDHNGQEPGSGPGWSHTGKVRRRGDTLLQGGDTLLRSKVSGGGGGGGHFTTGGRLRRDSAYVRTWYRSRIYAPLEASAVVIREVCGCTPIRIPIRV